MKTPFLIEVPRTATTSGTTRRQKVKAFKAKHRIATNDTKDPSDPGRWCAALLNESLQRYGCYCDEAKAEQDDQTLLFHLCAGACRLMDEAYLMVTGKSEVEAIRELCGHNNIQCDL